MPEREFIDSDKLLPTRERFGYSQAVKVGNTLYLAGQNATDKQGAVRHKRDFNGQLEMTLENLQNVIQAAVARFIRDGRPLRANHGDEHLAGGNGILQHLDEILARIDVVHIHEKVIRFKVLGQVVIQPPHVAFAVPPPVVDEDATHTGSSPCLPAVQPLLYTEGAVVSLG